MATQLEQAAQILTGTPPQSQEEELLQFPLMKLATCNLSQWALDFKGNTERILQSIELAKGCSYRIGPELEIPGYGCEDHFYEADTTKFSWLALRDILTELKKPAYSHTANMLIDLGMPILHFGVRYNCRVFVLKGKIVLIRPKMFLAEDGNYREGRYFTGWPKEKYEVLENYTLPKEISAVTDGQASCPFGIGILQARDATLAAETCEELFTPESPNIMLGLEGVDVITNGSGSHFQLGKYNYRHRLISGTTERNGGVYLYSNQLGLDGSRQVYDGNGMIYMNGSLKAIGEHLSFHEVEVVSAVVNLDEVRTYRAQIVSRNIQSARRTLNLPRISLPEDFHFTDNALYPRDISPTIPVPTFDMFEITTDDVKTYGLSVSDGKTQYATEEMALAIARYTWDYLTRGGVFGGFFLPLSGGVDSSSTACFIYYMCHKIVEFVHEKRTDQTTEDLRTLILTRLSKAILAWRLNPDLKHPTPPSSDDLSSEAKKLTFLRQCDELSSPDKLMNVILHTCNMPTLNNTALIKGYAQTLANGLGSYHLVAPIQEPFVAMKKMSGEIELPSKREAGSAPIPMDIPRYKLTSGDWMENLAIQNIQARLRMLTAFYLSQTLPLHRYNERFFTPEDWGLFLEVRAKAVQVAREAEDAVLDKKIAEAQAALSASGSSQDKETVEALQLRKGRGDEDIRYTGTPGSPGPLDQVLSSAEYSAEKDKVLAMQKMIETTRPYSKGLLVLASSNADEALRGFYTKYDASSADLNPIGSLSKKELRIFMLWFKDTFEGVRPDFKILHDILKVTASPELTPTDEEGQVQDDEIEIKMTYDNLNVLGRMRKSESLGPVSMFLKMCQEYIGKNIVWVHHRKLPSESSFQIKVERGKDGTGTRATYEILADIVKTFWQQYTVNRHKMNILTNGIHLTGYSPDDNRYDHRPFLLPNLDYQLKLIDSLTKQFNGKEPGPKPKNTKETDPTFTVPRTKTRSKQTMKMIGQLKEIESMLQEKILLGGGSKFRTTRRKAH